MYSACAPPPSRTCLLYTSHLNYEYDPYGDGTTDIASETYTGTLPDWEKKKILDLCISLAYIQEDGQWTLMDQSKQSYSDYEGSCIVYDFDFMEHSEDCLLYTSRCV